MIARQTIFILGAGASHPYGFSSGAVLLREARGLSFDNMLQKLQLPGIEAEAEMLLRDLRQTHDSSLDALLELRPNITPVGKRLTAALLLELEFHSAGRFPGPQDDWITLLFDELVADTTSLGDFVRNPVSFVTYNYDRLLEHRLLGALEAHYGATCAQCAHALKDLQIIHLHGDLGRLPDLNTDQVVPFGPDPTKEQFSKFIDVAASRIVIVHEAEPNTHEFKRALGLLRNTEQIVFLGFGFGKRNLARLELPSWKVAKHLFGTVYGLSPSRITYDVQRPFVAAGLSIQTGLPALGARDFLETYLQIFRDG